MNLPNFLIIGAAKSGTSALYRYLGQHPQIYMSARKEPHFFSFNSRTKFTQGPGDTIPLAITEFSEYCSLFEGVTDETVIGEASPTYLYVPGTAERISKTLPDVKMIAILRQPVERAYSAYMHVVRDGREPVSDFCKAIYEEERRIEDNWGPIWHYINGGFYYKQLMRYFSLFSDSQVKVILYDDFKENALKTIKGVFDFVGVESNFSPDVSVKPNVSGFPKSMFFHKLIHNTFMKDNPIKWISRLFIPEELRWRFTTMIRNKNLVKKPLSNNLKRRLTKRFYYEEIMRLQDLLDRDLSAWLE